MALTDRHAASAKPRDKDYKLADEKGLYLLVKKNGAKYWRLKYRLHGKEKTLALGVYPEVGLKAARTGRDEARQLLSQGIDPSAEKKARKQAQMVAATNSFEAIGREWYAVKATKWQASNSTKVLSRLEKILFPALGRRPITEITPPELLAVLRKIESQGTVETAHRIKQYASQIFRFAIATGRAERDPAADLTGALQSPTKKHHAAITNPKEVGKLMVAIDAYRGTPTVMAALKLSPLLFCRPGELRKLEWSEVDLERRQIELPAEKMKMKMPHVIPLCRQALEILAELEPITGRFRYVFPSARGASRPLSENGVRVALRAMGYDNQAVTPHGFRAMARTLLDEVLGFRVDWIEHQLAHAVKDANGRAYNRTKHLKQRMEMMQRWADYLDELKAQHLAQNAATASFGENGQSPLTGLENYTDHT